MKHTVRINKTSHHLPPRQTFYCMLIFPFLFFLLSICMFQWWLELKGWVNWSVIQQTIKWRHLWWSINDSKCQIFATSTFSNVSIIYYPIMIEIMCTASFLFLNIPKSTNSALIILIKKEEKYYYIGRLLSYFVWFPNFSSLLSNRYVNVSMLGLCIEGTPNVSLDNIFHLLKSTN